MYDLLVYKAGLGPTEFEHSANAPAPAYGQTAPAWRCQILGRPVRRRPLGLVLARSGGARALLLNYCEAVDVLHGRAYPACAAATARPVPPPATCTLLRGQRHRRLGGRAARKDAAAGGRQMRAMVAPSQACIWWWTRTSSGRPRLRWCPDGGRPRCLPCPGWARSSWHYRYATSRPGAGA